VWRHGSANGTAKQRRKRRGISGIIVLRNIISA
jgi:hypothetical protein